jgi:hypothetical protein
MAEHKQEPDAFKKFGEGIKTAAEAIPEIVGWIFGNGRNRVKEYGGAEPPLDLDKEVFRFLVQECAEIANLSETTVEPLVGQIRQNEGTFKDTPLESILRIELIVEEHEGKNVHYTLVFFLNREGKTIKRTTRLPISEKWGDVPQEIRTAMTKAQANSLRYLLYPLFV